MKKTIASGEHNGVPVRTITMRKTTSNTPHGFISRITIPDFPKLSIDEGAPSMNDPLFTPPDVDAGNET